MTHSTSLLPIDGALLATVQGGKLRPMPVIPGIPAIDALTRPIRPLPPFPRPGFPRFPIHPRLPQGNRCHTSSR